MALTISKLKMWKNPGYTRGCLEVPPPGSWKLPAADYTLAADETLRPHKGSTLTSLNLPLSFTQVFGMSYLYIEASDGAGSVSMFGWITSIEQRSTSAEGVTIRWDADWWRTYSGSATFGKGTITRCSNSTYKRPSAVQPRLWEVDKYESVTNSTKKYILVVYSETVGAITYIRYASWEVDSTITSGGNTYYTVSLEQLYSGILDECLHISPTTITGVFILDSQPFTFTATGLKTYGSYAWYISEQNSSMITRWVTLTNTYTTDDTHKAVVVDPYGTIVWELPWGMSINKCNITYDMGTSSASMILSMTRTTTALVELVPGAIGLLATVPLINVPVNSNAWSDYTFTYAREYDKQNREIARNQQVVSGIAGTGTSIIGGAVAGTMAAPGIGTVAGAVGGAASSLAGTGIDYVASGYFNDWLQDETDKLHSNQSANMLLPAGGSAWRNFEGGWKIVQLTADTVSAAEYSAFVSNNGYKTEIAVGNPNSFITAGGPLQIINLTITGNIPPQAKQYIKDKFETGVRIVENNPSGTAP